MDDLITSIRSKSGGGFDFTINWSNTGLNAFECEPPMIPVVCHFLVVFFHFLNKLTLFSPYLSLRSLIRLLSLFEYILEDSGSAENKEELLFSHDKLSLASILRPLHQVTKEMLIFLHLFLLVSICVHLPTPPSLYLHVDLQQCHLGKFLYNILLD